MPNAKQSNFISAFAVGTDARELVNLCVRDLGDISATANFGFIYASDALANQLPRLMSCLLYTSPSPRDRQKSRMPSSA